MNWMLSRIETGAKALLKTFIGFRFAIISAIVVSFFYQRCTTKQLVVVKGEMLF